MTLNPDPLRPADTDTEYIRGFKAGLQLRPTLLGVLLAGIALGLIAGILIGRSL